MEVLNIIQNRLDEISREGNKNGWETPQWTKEIKSGIAKIGKNFGYSIYASSADSVDGGEWLFDLCWLDYNDEDYLVNPVLIMELEWGKK